MKRKAKELLSGASAIWLVFFSLIKPHSESLSLLLFSLPLFILAYQLSLLWGIVFCGAVVIGLRFLLGYQSLWYLLLVFIPAGLVRWQQELLQAEFNREKQRLEKNLAAQNKKITALEEKIARELFNTSAIYEFTSILSSTINYQEILNLAVDTIYKIIPYDACRLYFINEEKGELYKGAGRGLMEEEEIENRHPIGTGLVGWVADRCQAALVADRQKDKRFQYGQWEQNFSSIMALPLKSKNQCIAVLEVVKTEPSAFDEDDLRILTIIANQAASAIRNANLYSQLAQQAITDPITGLINHRYFKIALVKEMKRASRYNRNLSLLMLDIDHFKSINDAHGHQTGDRVLAEFSKRLTSVIRENVDLIARYGGEEFCIILPETGQAEALEIAERIRQQIEQKPFSEQLELTVSIGVACFPQHAETSEELIKAADIACYQAKHSGRNLIRLAKTQ